MDSDPKMQIKIIMNLEYAIEIEYFYRIYFQQSSSPFIHLSLSLFPLRCQIAEKIVFFSISAKSVYNIYAA